MAAVGVVVVKSGEVFIQKILFIIVTIVTVEKRIIG
jgi:hypothetical protein